MSDIVERLRVLASGRTMTYDTGHIADGYDPMQAMGEAADEIDRLLADWTKQVETNDALFDEIDRLRKALTAIGEIEWDGTGWGADRHEGFDAMRTIARAALAKEAGQ